MKSITSLKNNFRVSILHPVCSLSLLLPLLPPSPWLDESQTLALAALGSSQKLKNECKDPRLSPHHSCCVAYGNSLPSGPLCPELWRWPGLEKMARVTSIPPRHCELTWSPRALRRLCLHLTIPVSIAVEKHKGQSPSETEIMDIIFSTFERC